MLDRLDALLADLDGQRVGLLGLGVAGRAMAALLLSRGAHVVIADARADVDCSALPDGRYTPRLGPVAEDAFADVALLVISPGANPRQPCVRAALRQGTPVCGELELVGRLPATVIAISGTNGKSTTTALAGALVQAAGKRAFVGGNLGDPISQWVGQGAAADVAVLELSSFQLETAYRFAPDVAVMLNVTPDHAERYDSFDDYVQAKRRLLGNLTAAQHAVLNADDEIVAAMGQATAAHCWWFSSRSATIAGDGVAIVCEEGRWLLRGFGAAACLDGFDLAHARLLGAHNRENAAAALLAAVAAGLVPDAASIERLVDGYRAFAGLAHRLEWVADVAGVRWINDSKATNDESAAVAVRAIERIGVLLLGGVDKGGGYGRVLAEALAAARLVIAYGQARPIIEQAFAAHPGLRGAVSLREALPLAQQLALPGETVLLAPACSSFDEFSNYAARGETFRAFVGAIASGAQP